jgi:hypothetical protein
MFRNGNAFHPGRMAVTAKRKSVLSPTPMITGLSGRFSER